MPPGPTTVDQTWLNFVGLEPDSAGYWIAVILAEVGGGAGVVICTGVLAAVFVFLRRLRAAGVLVTTMLTGIALSQLLKAVVIRLRPSEQLYDSLGYSYPSGHSMAAAALASALAFIASRAHVLKLAEAAPHLHRSSSDRDHSPAQTCPDAFHWSMILAFAWIVLMMWSRTALQVHWLSDTIAGALIGISAAVLADELWTWVTMRTRSPHRRR
ncbi:MAG: phosphatase PAP2 family protein [Brevibacterium sp.]|nr:phosphatase PAP2 family protein [Brevibacterium sp.]